MIPAENTEIFECTLTSCWWGMDGILYSVSKPAERTIENYKELLHLYARLSDDGNKRFCVLGDITETTPLAKDVRDFVAEETGKYVKAMALVSSSAMGTATGSIYEMLSKTPYVVGTFVNRDDAVRWLKTQMSADPVSLNTII